MINGLSLRRNDGDERSIPERLPFPPQSFLPKLGKPLIPSYHAPNGEVDGPIRSDFFLDDGEALTLQLFTRGKIGIPLHYPAHEFLLFDFGNTVPISDQLEVIADAPKTDLIVGICRGDF